MTDVLSNMTKNDLIATFLLSVVLCSFIYLGLSGVKADSEIVPQKADVVEQVEEKKVVETHDITHKGRPQDSVVQEYVRYAYKISGGDMDFITTLEAENGRRDPHRQSDYIQKNGKREESYGFCQMMKVYHKEVHDQRFWDDRKWQMDTCYRKYKGGTKFYGYYARHKLFSRFETKHTQKTNQPKKVGAYYKAKNKQVVLDQLSVEVPKLRDECKKSGECKE